MLGQWWSNSLPKSVKFVFLVLLANAVPAFLILMLLPAFTDILFVWTIKPEINARLVGAMYSNALLLVSIGMLQPDWPRVRIIMVVITLFSVMATLLTFVYLDPFLAHPWYHLAYWLSMYLVLFFAAPYVFYVQERKSGGRLPISTPLTTPARLFAGIALVISLICGLGLLFAIDTVNQYWPWTLPPLVGGLIGVLLTSHAVAFGWALWDGDWIRTRPMFWQAPVTALIFLLLPITHADQLRPDAGSALTLYIVILGFMFLASSAVILSYRSVEKSLSGNVT